MNLFKDIARMIDHTLLKPDATAKMIEVLCQEAIDFQFKSVCVHPWWVKEAVSHLKGSSILVSTVLGFPMGMTYPTLKIDECGLALEEGASEFDMVINIGALKSNRYDFIREEIEGVVKKAQGRTVKVILETCFLTREEKILACQLAKDAGADFVKTSTGFGTGGATLEDIALMVREAGSEMAVKASGGIRDYRTAAAMIAEGAARIGTSAGVSIIKEMHTEGIGV